MEPHDSPPPRRGRGAGENPPNRYERIHVTEDPAELEDEELRQVPTEFFVDDSRSLLSENDSPDVPFDYSINPYRGCEHGCVYCVDGETRILMADGRSRPIRDLVVGDRIVGTRRDGGYRKFVETEVLDRWSAVKEAYRVDLADGTSIVASGDHRFLTHRGWMYVAGGPTDRPKIGPGTLLRSVRTGSGTARRPEPTSVARGPVSANRPAATREASAGRTPQLPSGRALPGSTAVATVEALGRRRRMYDVTTGTGDFVADGVVSHNCYARPTHEYLGFSAGLDFESKILVKEHAPELLRAEFEKKSWSPQVVAVSGSTDPYQPGERELEVTRGCLEVFLEARNPVSIITKNELVTRDADVLERLAEHDLVHVTLSVTSLRDEVVGKMEPRTSRPERRLKAVEELAERGVPVGINIAPVIPGLTDEEIPRILEAAAERGARRAGWVMLRLPGPVEDLFVDWLEREFPDRREKVLNRLRSVREGKLSESEFGRRMRGKGPFADTISSLFEMSCRRLGLNEGDRELRTDLFRRPASGQGELF